MFSCKFSGIYQNNTCRTPPATAFVWCTKYYVYHLLTHLTPKFSSWRNQPIDTGFRMLTTLAFNDSIPFIETTWIWHEVRLRIHSKSKYLNHKFCMKYFVTLSLVLMVVPLAVIHSTTYYYSLLLVVAYRNSFYNSLSLFVPLSFLVTCYHSIYHSSVFFLKHITTAFSLAKLLLGAWDAEFNILWSFRSLSSIQLLFAHWISLILWTLGVRY